MDNTFYYGYMTGALVILWLQLIKSFNIFSVLSLSAILLMCVLALLLEENKLT